MFFATDSGMIEFLKNPTMWAVGIIVLVIVMGLPIIKFVIEKFIEVSREFLNGLLDRIEKSADKISGSMDKLGDGLREDNESLGKKMETGFRDIGVKLEENSRETRRIRDDLSRSERMKG
ncbi:MAG: hypothetical protein K8T10_16235 [Candidatus Eremiobacteraeota bacterium]|nr:hypothetical protein [Candidatus Eremiobacteraeota bacterium]